MEKIENTNESNLPEEGAQKVNEPVENQDSEKSTVNESVEETKADPENKEELKQEVASLSETSENDKEEVLENKAEAIPDSEINEEVNQEEQEVTDARANEGEQAAEERKEETAADEADAFKNSEEPLSSESSEKKKEQQKKVAKFEAEEYSKMDKQSLLSKLNSLLNTYDVETIKDAVEEIRTVFYKQYKAEITEAKKAFIDEGGVEEDFKHSDESSEETFKLLYNRYKERKAELNKQLEKEKGINIKVKYNIIEEIKELINKEESINKTFHEFRELQQRWREVGLVPQSAVKSLWESYNHAVEQFYDYIKINKELRDLDLKKNLEEKIKLCEKAEALILEESITKAFKILQEYHNRWRETGPVPSDQKDSIWDRFKAATSQINKKHQEYFEGLKGQQVQNLEQKTALCEKVEELTQKEMRTPKDWEAVAKEIIEVQKLWRTIGFAPKKDNNKIYQRFKSACDEYFSKKREFYKEAKEIQKNNMQLKLDLCVQAEALKDSTEWKKTTEDFINLQKKWKEIGPVPRKHSESLWKRFRTACDYFFNTKSDFFNTVDSRQEDNLKLKLDLIEEVKSFKKADSDKESLKLLMDIQKRWSEIGHVPINKKDEIQKEFREAVDKQFEDLNIESDERNKLNYKSKVENWASHKSRNKLYSERNKLINKIKELENEIALYENNIGFFSASSNSQSLMNDVNKKIDKAKERMESLKQKLKMLDKAEDDLL